MHKLCLRTGNLLAGVVLCLVLGTQSISAQDALGSLLGQSVASQKVEEPFSVQVTPEEQKDQRVALVAVQIASGHYLYKDHFVVTAAGGVTLNPVEPIPSQTIKDPFSGEDKDVFKNSFSARYIFNSEAESRSLKVEYMGCNAEMCFMPQEFEQTLSWAGSSAPAPAPQETGAPSTSPESNTTGAWQKLADSFTTKASASGSMDKQALLQFLNSGLSQNGEEPALTGIEGFLARWGLFITIPVIIFLGIGLNLTPCVLPMIPINLAIIGAGVKAGSKGQGFLLGGIYGLGMALAYGALGLAVVLAGATFGALNSSPWFNFATAAIFIILSLAMFDVFTIDLSRFQGHTNLNAKTGIARYILIFGLGAFSALLAGACVAPALISVLLISANIYNAGNYAGLLLPFLLGLGMALPWPVAGAGLAALPKPGMWMTRVKQAFGVLIILFAVYYGYEGYKLWQGTAQVTRLEAVSLSEGDSASASAPLDAQLQEAMEESLATGKPIFLDFWATWCKSCMYMEKTTFSDPEVQQRLESDWIVLKLQAEQPKKSPAREILEYYHVIGLPTYLLLEPIEKEK